MTAGLDLLQSQFESIWVLQTSQVILYLHDEELKKGYNQIFVIRKLLTIKQLIWDPQLKPVYQSQLVFQCVVFLHVELLFFGTFVEVMQKLPVFCIWINVVLQERFPHYTFQIINK